MDSYDNYHSYHITGPYEWNVLINEGETLSDDNQLEAEFIETLSDDN